MNSATDTILICTGFFGYGREIKAQLERRGRVVAIFEDRPATDTITKLVIRFAPQLMRAKADVHFAAIARSLKNCPVRDVLVVKGEAVSPAAIRNMRRIFPGACFTLYFWDSYRNLPSDSREKVSIVDRALTFDPNDAKADARLVYRPLFFLEEYAALREQPQFTDIDLLFLGTVHSDRYAVLKRLSKALPPNLYFMKILYFPARWLYFLRKALTPAMWTSKSREFIFKPLGKAEITALVARSRIVVDIEQRMQTGYTMRTLEMVGGGKKFITTNPEVAKADFFDPNNIAIVDRMAPVLSDAFLNTPYRPLPPDVVDRYSIARWLNDVLPHTKPPKDQS